MASVGIRVDDGRITTVIPRSTPLPARISKVFTSGGTLEILAVDHPMIESSYWIGHMDMRPSIPVGAVVNLIFDIDAEGVLAVTAEDVRTYRIAKGSFPTHKHLQWALTCKEHGGAWHAFTSLEEQLRAVKRALAGEEEATDVQSIEDYAANCSRTDLDGRLFGEALEENVFQSTRSGVRWRQEVGESVAAGVHHVLLGAVVAALSLAWLLAQRAAQVQAQGAAQAARAASCATGGAAEACDRDQRIVRLEDELRQAISERKRLEEEVQAARTDRPKDASFQAVSFDEVAEGVTTRFVQIECPGLTHDDVEIEIIFNGAVVKLRRREDRRAPALEWEAKFQYSLEEGHFEFKEEEIQLEYGILTLVFRAYTPRSRVFRFPQRKLREGMLGSATASWTLALDRRSAGSASGPPSRSWHQEESVHILAADGSALDCSIPPAAQEGNQGQPPRGAELVGFSGLPTDSSRSAPCASSEGREAT